MAETQGHIENFNGVDIKFSPPNIPEQNTFQLRDVLNKKETEILVEAIPVIAKFLNYIRRKDIGFSEKLSESRKPYQFIEDKKVWLAPTRTHSWKVSEDKIMFVTDYIVNYGDLGGGTMGEYYFRDAYVFKKVDGKWFFSENFGSKPYGFLKCKHADEKCTSDVNLW